MLPADSRDRLVVLAIGLLILFAPVLVIVLTIGFLSITGELVLGEITLLEFVELYVIDLIVFAILGYGIYRLTLWLAVTRLSDPLDDRDSDGDDDDRGRSE